MADTVLLSITRQASCVSVEPPIQKDIGRRCVIGVQTPNVRREQGLQTEPRRHANVKKHAQAGLQLLTQSNDEHDKQYTMLSKEKILRVSLAYSATTRMFRHITTTTLSN